MAEAIPSTLVGPNCELRKFTRPFQPLVIRFVSKLRNDACRKISKRIPRLRIPTADYPPLSNQATRKYYLNQTPSSYHPQPATTPL